MGKEESVNPAVKFYCVTCRKEQVMYESAVNRESRPKGADILRATCPICAGKLVKFVKRQAP